MKRRNLFLAPFLVGGMLAQSANGATAVPSDAQKVQPLSVGVAAPAFTLRKPDGTSYRFEAGRRASPAVVVFYRGGWCPYCNTHLGELKAAEATLRERGYEVLFLSADRPEILHSSLKDDVENDAASYRLLSDSAAEGSRAFGVAFRVDDETFARYRASGLDLEQAAGNAQHILPVPAVFVIDRGGVIRFAYANADYKIRLSANKLLAAAPAVPR